MRERGRRADDAPRLAPAGREASGPLRGRVHWLDAETVLDELDDDQLALSMRIAGLERAWQLASRDAAGADTVRFLPPRLDDLAGVCESLHAVQEAGAAPGAHRAFLPDAPLADYVRGVYAWTNAVVRALEELAVSARRREREPLATPPRGTTMAPGWPAYRSRIEVAKNLHFHELERAIRLDLAQLIEDTDDGDDRDAVDFTLTGQGSHALDVLLGAFDSLLRRARALEAGLDRDGSDGPLGR